MGNIEHDYDLICEEVPEYKQFTLKEYAEIMMMVTSRIFTYKVDGVKIYGLVPYADMLNHQNERQTTWTYSDSRHGFIIEAMQDIKQGE